MCISLYVYTEKHDNHILETTCQRVSLCIYNQMYNYVSPLKPVLCFRQVYKNKILELLLLS